MDSPAPSVPLMPFVRTSTPSILRLSLSLVARPDHVAFLRAEARM